MSTGNLAAMIAGVTLNDIVFFLIAGVTILAALGVVSFRNIVHSALSLVLAFLGVAAIYFQLNAGFIGLVQIMVYAGAISVLIIFAVMLVMDKEVQKTNLPTPRLGSRLIGAYISVLLVVVLGASIWFSHWPIGSGQLSEGAVGILASLLMGDYIVAFEVAAILLLVAVVGAIILAKGAEDK